jgi:signal transduction histidine kinase
MARTTRRSGQSKPSKPRQHTKTDAAHLAALYVQARATLVRAGRALHDHVGSPLTAAGVQLQLLRMDLPDAATQIGETLQLLEDVLDRVRSLSQELGRPAWLARLSHRYRLFRDGGGSRGNRGGDP